MEAVQSEQQKEKLIKKYENSIRDRWDNIKCTSICIIGVPDAEKREMVHKFIWGNYGWKPPKLEGN